MLQMEKLLNSNKRVTLFNLLAATVSEFSSKDLRRMIGEIRASTEEKVAQDLKRFGVFFDAMHDSYKSQYQLALDVVKKIMEEVNECFKSNDYLAIGHFIELMDQAIGGFEHAYPYIGLKEKAWSLVVHLPPLNDNYNNVGVKLYPVVRPFWALKKAEEQRALNINSLLNNYHVIFSEAEKSLTIDYYYLKSDLLARSIEKNAGISIALSPVCNCARPNTQYNRANNVSRIKILGLDNNEYVNNRVIQIFKIIFQQEFGIIAFPELIGSRYILKEIQSIMADFPQRASLVFLPTFYEEGKNKEIVLGPGGYPVHEQHKIVAFNVLQNGKAIQEDIIPGDSVKILLAEGLGAIATPICMDLIEREGAGLLHEQITANTIICPSFSPGIQAFQDALAKGNASHTLELWLNTCSAHNTDFFAHDYGFEKVGMIHLPEVPVEQSIHRFDCIRKCNGICSDELCYFNITLKYIDNKFHINGIHEIA